MAAVTVVTGARHSVLENVPAVRKEFASALRDRRTMQLDAGGGKVLALNPAHVVSIEGPPRGRA